MVLGYLVGVLGHLARRLKMATRPDSAANGLKLGRNPVEKTILEGQEAENERQWPDLQQMGAEIPSKRSFWRGSGAPGQEAENGRQGQICSKWLKLGRNPIEKAIPEGFWAPGQEAENGSQGQICSNWAEIPSKRSFWKRFWGTWPGG